MNNEQILKIAKECGFSFAGRNPVVVMCSVAELENFRKALIEHDAPSAPIEAEQSGKDEALNMAIEAINMHRARYDNLVNAITNAIEIGNKPLIPSTQAKESEG